MKCYNVSGVCFGLYYQLHIFLGWDGSITGWNTHGCALSLTSDYEANV